ncbi:MAG: HDOD domain-containing protein [Opitutaceae bacterium]
MANLLLVDSNEVAHRALRGMLSRGSHRCAVAGTAEEAWRLLREFVAFDLVVLELTLPGENGVRLLQRIRADPLLKKVPLIVYTSVADPKVVKAVLATGVQNYLVKPYREDVIYRELEKALRVPWRSMHFEEEKSFCAQLQLDPSELKRRRVELEGLMEPTGRSFAAQAAEEHPAHAEVLRQVLALSEKAEEAGVWAVAEYLAVLRAGAERGDWSLLRWAEKDFAWMGQLIFDHLHPGMLRATGFGEDDRHAAEEAQRHAQWLDADVIRGGPLVPEGVLEAETDKLAACPVIDTVLAAFQMAADRTGSHLQQVVDLVDQDPGLACTVLMAANQLKHDAMTTIEDLAGAVSLLGSERLATLAKQIPSAKEESFFVPPLTWPQFWRFQVGVGRLSRVICEYLQFKNAASVAYQAGLMHDIGKLVLAHLHPYAVEATVRHARDHRVSLHEAERRYLRCDTRDLGERLARRLGLPERCCAVIRFVERPLEAEAGEVGELVCAVALARELCLYHHIGSCGDPTERSAPAVEQTLAWTAIRPRLFPGFKMAEFEIQLRRTFFELKEATHG